MVEVKVKENLEDVRNRLIADCRREPEAHRAGYINGILDMYVGAKKVQAESEVK